MVEIADPNDVWGNDVYVIEEKRVAYASIYTPGFKTYTWVRVFHRHSLTPFAAKLKYHNYLNKCARLSHKRVLDD